MTLKFDHHLSEAQELNVKVGFVEGSAASVNRCSLAKCEYVLSSSLTVSWMSLVCGHILTNIWGRNLGFWETVTDNFLELSGIL